jgi:hypothetical protein
LIGHCIIYLGCRGSNSGHPIYLEFLVTKLFDKKKTI